MICNYYFVVYVSSVFVINLPRAKSVYVGGLLFYCAGMSLMAMTRARLSVIVFSWAAGVMYSTLFTMPYLLVAHYHAIGTVRIISFNHNL